MSRYPIRTVGRSAVLWILVLCSALCSNSKAQDFEVLWGASSGVPQDGETWETWRDWDQLVDVGETGICRDRAVFLYESDFGLSPRAGLHQVQIDPTWMDRHRAAILATITRSIPDPDYSGLAIIDYETWGFSWDTMANEPNPGGAPDDPDRDFQDDWRDYVQRYIPWTVQDLTPEQAEPVYRDLYNQAARAFILETIRYSKSLRPNAKWGFYGFPYRSYYKAQDPTDAAAYEAFLQGELGWLYAEQDAFFPDIYSLYLTEGNDQPSAPFRDRETAYLNFLSWNIQWAMEASDGRPVYPLVWMRYHQNAGPYAGMFVNEINMQYPIRVAQQMGTSGVVIWEAFGSMIQAQRYQEFVNNQLRPFLKPYLDRCPADFDGDRAVSVNDLLLFLWAFENGQSSADLSNQSQTYGPDSAVDIDDFLYFVNSFEQGC